MLRVTPPQGAQAEQATVAMTDITDGGRTKKLKVTLAVDALRPYVMPRPPAARSRRRRLQDAAAAAAEERRVPGVSYEFQRWPALDRQHGPKKAKRLPDAQALHGPPLLARLEELLRLEQQQQHADDAAGTSTGADATAADMHHHLAPGTRIWVHVAGEGTWPGVAWALGLCLRKDLGELLKAHRPGLVLIRFYGEHSHAWVRREDCELPPADEAEHLRQLRAAGRQHNKCAAAVRVGGCMRVGGWVGGGMGGVDGGDEGAL